jgi:PIN domain nuclease of toxin-antitoxin system
VRILLDTKAILWYLINDNKLSTKAEALISEPANQILVSPVSYLEIAIKITIMRNWKS